MDRFRGITFEQFAGAPSIGDVPHLYIEPTRAPVAFIEFFGEYRVKHWHARGDIVLADMRVAAFLVADRKGDSKLWTHPEYRRRGLGEELVYRVLTRCNLTVTSTIRTEESQRLYRRVYDRIQRELEGAMT